MSYEILSFLLKLLVPSWSKPPSLLLRPALIVNPLDSNPDGVFPFEVIGDTCIPLFFL